MIARAPKLGPLMVAMVTPFDAQGALDLAQARRLARFLVAQGHDGIVVSGTTGESPTLSDDEKLALLGAVKEAAGERASVVAGSGGNDTRHSVALTRRAEAAGADAILAVVPYYNRPPQDGLLGHFGAIAEATRLPVIVYNIPSRTGANLLPATLLELARRYQNIVGVKEASGDVRQFTAILRERPAGFGFWSGDDGFYLPVLALGGEGLISVASHLCARELVELRRAFVAGEVARAGDIHRALMPLFDALFATTNPIPVKWAMNELGFFCGPCRPPLGALPTEQAVTLGALLAPYRERARAADGIAV
ncbi:MAG: 4-hydroxy-tetrahydrodipicolinate synthase [Vulcanimicrobiaceae bacterium]